VEGELRSVSLSARVAALLEDDGRFWLLCAVVLGTVAFFKGFRLPSTWAATQAQFGYDHGFAKRSLFGALFTRPLHLWLYGRLSIFCTAILLALVGALAWFARWAGVARRVSPDAVTAVFFSSYTITFLAYINGRFEIFQGLFAILLLCVRNPVVRLLVGLPVIVVAVLMHEMFLLAYLPVVLLSFVLNAALEMERRRAVRDLVLGGLLALFALIVTVVIAKQPSFTVAQVLAYQQEIAHRINFTLETTFYMVLARSAGDNWRLMTTFFHKVSWWMDMMGGLVTMLPLLFFLLWLVRRMLSGYKAGWRRWVFPACVVAGLAPISLNLLGFDVGRWWALSGLTTFLVFGSVCAYVPGPTLWLRPATCRIALLVIALSMASGDGLIDPGTTIQAYPYTTEIKDTVKAILLHRWQH
jgi:hypothetical protein